MKVGELVHRSDPDKKFEISRQILVLFADSQDLPTNRNTEKLKCIRVVLTLLYQNNTKILLIID